MRRETAPVVVQEEFLLDERQDRGSMMKITEMMKGNLKGGSLAFFFALLLSGCSGLTRQPAVPEALQDQAHVPGMEGVRYRGGDDISAMAREGIEALHREQAYLA